MLLHQVVHDPAEAPGPGGQRPRRSARVETRQVVEPAPDPAVTHVRVVQVEIPGVERREPAPGGSDVGEGPRPREAPTVKRDRS